MKWLMVGGKFDDEGGAESGYVRKLFDALSDVMVDGGTLYNGGTYDFLKSLEQQMPKYGAILWFPDVPNTKGKLVNRIKKIAPKSLLVISKNNKDNGHDMYDLLSRALVAKANLLVSFTGEPDRVCAWVIDPLGNLYGESDDIKEVALALACRLLELLRFTRIGSQEVPGGCHDADADIGLFLKYARHYATVFHELVHGAVNPKRFLGNCSFRCGHGFPSYRGEQGMAWVSRRDMDKREIGGRAFVPCKLVDGKVLYWRPAKPSVDAPVQLLLYRYYPRINYMLHSHAYIKGVPKTSRVIPCGAVEEFYEIVSRASDRNLERLSVNLIGHGSLVMSSTVEDFKGIDYFSRPMPELIRIERF